MDRPRQAPRRFVALTAAISLHVLLMLALVSQSPSPPGPSSVNIIQLELRPTSGEPRRPPIERQPQGNTGPISPGPATPATPAPVTPLPISLSANPSPPTPPREGEGLRHALNSAFGCDLPGGPRPEDRVRCAERFARAGGPPRSFGIDPAQRAYFDAKAQQAQWWQQPLLATIPKNGCAPLATNQQAGVTGGEVTADSRWRLPGEAWRTGGPSSAAPPLALDIRLARRRWLRKVILQRNVTALMLSDDTVLGRLSGRKQTLPSCRKA